MKATEIKEYLTTTYGKVTHDVDKLEGACKEVAHIHSVDPEDIFHFMVENQEIVQLYTHSYGFNTAYGRQLKTQFSEVYDSM